MKQVRVDDNAHSLLKEVKKDMKEEGIEAPSMSDAIRHIYNYYEMWKVEGDL